MPASEALASPSWLKINLTRKCHQRDKLSHLSRSDQKLSPRTTKLVSLLEKNLVNLRGISRVCALSVVIIRTDACLNGQKISHQFIPNKRYATNFVECMQICLAVYFRNNTYRWICQHSS